MSTDGPDVVIVGGGPSGLTAAAALATAGAGRVMVVERETEAGGIPRHSDHTGYGLRDRHRVMTGPKYARTLVRQAEQAGVEIRTRTMITGWAGDQLEYTSPGGRGVLTARAIVLATGARERPRTARMIPGDRVSGVYTTGHLQNLVHLQHQELPGRAVIVGAELVSWSAVLTLRHAGATPVLMTSKYSTAESYKAFSVPGRIALRVPVATATEIVGIIGHGRVEAVELRDADGRHRTVPCETVVLTGDWIPDHELARAAGLTIDPASQAPVVDGGLRTERDGVFAIGNLVHPVDTADVAALDGRHVVPAVLDHLAGHDPRPPAVSITASGAAQWISPGHWRAGERPSRRRLVTWPEEFVRFPNVTVRQDGRTLDHKRLAWPASPGRMLRIPDSILDKVDPAGGSVNLHIG